MKTYKIRIILKKSRNHFHRKIKALNFEQAMQLAKKKFTRLIKDGHDVQIYNPGE